MIDDDCDMYVYQQTSCRDWLVDIHELPFPWKVPIELTHYRYTVQWYIPASSKVWREFFKLRWCERILPAIVCSDGLFWKCLLAVEEYASLVPVALELWLYSVTIIVWVPDFAGLFIAKTRTFTLRLHIETFVCFALRWRQRSPHLL